MAVKWPTVVKRAWQDLKNLHININFISSKADFFYVWKLGSYLCICHVIPLCLFINTTLSKWKIPYPLFYPDMYTLDRSRMVSGCQSQNKDSFVAAWGLLTLWAAGTLSARSQALIAIKRQQEERPCLLLTTISWHSSLYLIKPDKK